MTEETSAPITASRSFVDEIWTRLDETFSRRIEKKLKRFASTKRCSGWLIATDFCTAEPSRPNDSFCYVIYPAGEHLHASLALCNKLDNRDLKKVKEIPLSIVRALKEGSVFTICVVADRDRRLFASTDDARKNMDATIDMMKRWQNADECAAIIKQAEDFRRDCQGPGFNQKLVSNIIINSLLVSYIAFLLVKHSNAGKIGWAPDRGDIMEAFGSVSNSYFAVNVSALCQRHNMREPILEIYTQENGDLWCDPLIRLPDYVSGAAAAWDPPSKKGLPKKIVQMVRKVFSDNPYLFLVRLSFKAEPGTFSSMMDRISVSKRPFSGTKRKGTLLQGRSKQIASKDIHTRPEKDARRPNATIKPP